MNIASLLKEAELSPSVLENRGEYIQTVRHGIPGRIVKLAVNTLGEKELFTTLLNTNASNLSRYYHKTLTRFATENILDTLRVFQAAINAFEDEELATEWLHTSIPALAGERPINLCDTAEGREIVKESLRTIEYGEFS
ncbi:MAG: antitoxin Xre/MbcA/ParS toxin-binding domain-containing protein [Cyanobacteria bacterium J06631_2]